MLITQQLKILSLDKHSEEILLSRVPQTMMHIYHGGFCLNDDSEKACENMCVIYNLHNAHASDPLLTLQIASFRAIKCMSL